MPLSPKCPHCGSAETSRSRRRLLERLMLAMRPYRCDYCSRRFMAFHPQGKVKDISEARID